MFQPAILLGAALACGLMIGVERGWRLRREPAGTRVAGVRTYTLLGLAGGIAALLGTVTSFGLAAVLVITVCAGLTAAYWRQPSQRDATSFVAAMVALSLGLLAGAGQPQLAIAASAVITLILATRQQSHRFVSSLNDEDVHAFARYAVIAFAVLPFLPNRSMGPLSAWNPFQLWLVVVLVTGFSFAGYIANRSVGAKRGVLATAIIGGAYSSTAVTASLAQRLGPEQQSKLFTAGIVLASAIMYLRVILIVALLTPSTVRQFLITIGPAAVVGSIAAGVAWYRSPRGREVKAEAPGNPIELLPAFGFVAIVAIGALATRWAQNEFGESGTATSLFLTGAFDVDAAVVTLSGLPPQMIDRRMAALVLAATVAANMALKILVTLAYARRAGAAAASALTASTVILIGAIGWRWLGGI